MNRLWHRGSSIFIAERLQRESSTSSTMLSARLLQRESSISIVTALSSPTPRGSSISIATILHRVCSISTSLTFASDQLFSELRSCLRALRKAGCSIQHTARRLSALQAFSKPALPDRQFYSNREG